MTLPRRLAVGAPTVFALLAWVASLRAATITGRVREYPGGAPIRGVQIEVLGDPHRSLTDEDGRFRLTGVVADPLRLQLHRLGYRDTTVSLAPGGADTLRVELNLSPRPVVLPGLEVRDQAGSSDRFGSQRPVEVTGLRLRERLAPTIAEVLANEPGLAQRTMGPTPARPILRGLGGDRLLVLEDGMSAGDLSSTSDDHAVTIEPAASRAVEVLRGPSTLELGSNVLAGVVNVRHEYVPERLATRWGLSVMGQGESATEGEVGNVRAVLPMGPWVATLQGTRRTAGNLHTPEGPLGNTSLRSSEVSAGAARFWPHGRVGGSLSRYDSRYGVPGGFLGGHQSGADIALDRERAELAADFLPSGESGPRLESEYLFTRYYHEELESIGIPAISFGLLTYTASTRLRWPARGSRGSGVVGISGEYRDSQSGYLTFTPPTLERAGAAYTSQSWDRGPWKFTAGFRMDARTVAPAGRDTNKAGIIRERSFAGWSGGIQAEWRGRQWLTLTTNLMRTFLAPSVEHLFAEGPHLAAYSYDIGNADLDPEVGVGLNLTARVGGERTHATVSGYRNAFANYLYAANTGQLEVGPGAEGLLARYQFRGDPAALVGCDLEMAVGLASDWELAGTGSYVRGTLRRTDGPLPLMPPAKGRLSLRWGHGSLTANVSLTGAASQRRIGEFESPTAGWCSAGCGLGWSQSTTNRQVNVLLGAENVLDADYRDHLSRIKSIMPEAGRNMRLLVQTAF